MSIERHCFVESSAGGFDQKPVEKTELESAPAEVEDLTLELQGAVLHLGLCWDERRTDAPWRPQRARVIALSPGSTARLVINGRHSSWDEQWYTQHTFNVAFMNDIAEDVFVARPPEQVFTQEADLF
jgi:hypothetical protein